MPSKSQVVMTRGPVARIIRIAVGTRVVTGYLAPFGTVRVTRGAEGAVGPWVFEEL